MNMLAAYQNRGAGLSMAPPSLLPAAETLAAAAKEKYDAIYGTTRDPLATNIEDQAEYFFRRHELATVYFRTLIDLDAFAGPPNRGTMHCESIAHWRHSDRSDDKRRLPDRNRRTATVWPGLRRH